MSILTSLLHRVVAIPFVYDLAQVAAGARLVQHRLRQAIVPYHEAHRVLDLGGGTGLHRNLWNNKCDYICLDLDAQKLTGFRARHVDGLAILADATRVPVRAKSFDIVMCTFVAHHISDDLLNQFVAEAMRILKDDGYFIFLDPLWQPRRGIGKLLWKYDRGKFPRTAKMLRNVLSQQGVIRQEERFAVLHEYWLCVVAKSVAS